MKIGPEEATSLGFDNVALPFAFVVAGVVGSALLACSERIALIWKEWLREQELKRIREGRKR